MKWDFGIQGAVASTLFTPTLTLPWKSPLRASQFYWSRHEVKLLARTSPLPVWPTYPWPTPQNYGKTGLTLFMQCEGLWFEACLINNQALMKLFQIQRLQDGAWEYEHECTYKRNTEERSGKYGCRGKAVSITYPECVCSLAYPVCNAHAHIILSSFACLALPYFSTLSDKRQDFRGKKSYRTYNV